MDQPPLPSAADLGLTEVEYERVLRGLRQREQLGLRPPDDARGLVESEGRIEFHGPPTRVPAPAAQPARRRPASWWRFAVLPVCALVALTLRHGTSSANEPAYAFGESVGGQPVTYSSCKPIRVEVYPAGGPSDSEALVREAVDRMRSATGLDIVVTGVFGGHAPGFNFEAAPVVADEPVSVSWQDHGAIADLTDDIAGLGGSVVMDGPRGTKHLEAGTIALSRDYYQQLEQTGDHAEELAVLLHEFGHVLGLAHVDSPGELMYHGNVGRTTFGPGDLEGLRLAGKGPCL